jgi:hypothetical protein
LRASPKKYHRSSRREHYELLCEWCHPNGVGHWFTFGEFDQEERRAIFDEAKLYHGEMLNMVTTGYSMLPSVEAMMDELDALIIALAKIPSTGEVRHKV